MTLLQSTNRVLRDLREDSINSLDDTDQVLGIVDSLNRGAHRVLHYHTWSFLVRDDGYAFFPAMFSVTSGGIFTSGSTAVSLNVGSASNAWATSDVTDFTTNVRAKVRPTGSDEFGDTSFILTNLNTDISKTGTLSAAYEGTTLNVTTGAWEVYTHEYVLPSTVRSVLSVRNEEAPGTLQAIGSQHQEFDTFIPRVTDGYRDRPSLAYVGDYITTTTKDSAAATEGMALVIWPPPSSDVHLRYSYVYRQADLSADAESWTGVPAEHVSVIEEFALAEKLLDNRSADTERGLVHERRALARLDQLKQEDKKQSFDRKVMQPYRGGALMRGYRSRWASQEIDAP